MVRIVYIILIIIGFANQARSQYISRILEYTPAPGQHINTPSGSPYAAGSIVGGIQGSLSLGAFGGYVVFDFGQAVHNHPDHPFGVDFTIFGNAITDWSEPAVVWVMQDENWNGLPDDTWYELAGSDHDSAGTLRNYRVTWFRESDTLSPVTWTDNHGGSGELGKNEIHTQPWYPLADSFPQIGKLQYTLQGTLILTEIDSSDLSTMKSFARAFGYADNLPRGNPPWTLPDNPATPEIENAGGDAFDLEWAVDSFGHAVNLDSIHFIKVQSAALASAGWLGELSTELSGAVMVEPVQTGSRTGLIDGDIRIYPNPFRDMISVEGGQGGKVEIYSTSGRKVHTSPMNSDLSGLELGHLAPGIYFLRITSRSRYLHQKIIKK